MIYSHRKSRVSTDFDSVALAILFDIDCDIIHGESTLRPIDDLLLFIFIKIG